jgi:hypothetical protein
MNKNKIQDEFLLSGSISFENIMLGPFDDVGGGGPAPIRMPVVTQFKTP